MPFLPTLPWPALIFWAAIVGGLVIAGLGLVRRRPSLLIGAAFLLLPASLYLTATPGVRRDDRPGRIAKFQFVGWVPVACLLLAAYAVRRNRVWPGGLLVACGVVFWSVVASMLAFPILFHVLVAGTAIGLVAAQRLSWKILVYVPGGIVGAFVGALLTFGDAPFLMRHPSLNPWTVSVLAAACLVTVLAVADRKVLGR